MIEPISKPHLTVHCEYENRPHLYEKRGLYFYWTIKLSGSCQIVVVAMSL